MMDGDLCSGAVSSRGAVTLNCESKGTCRHYNSLCNIAYVRVRYL